MSCVWVRHKERTVHADNRAPYLKLPDAVILKLTILPLNRHGIRLSMSSVLTFIEIMMMATHPSTCR